MVFQISLYKTLLFEENFPNLSPPATNNMKIIIKEKIKRELHLIINELFILRPSIQPPVLFYFFYKA